MKDMAPEDALKELLASVGTFETTAADQEKALQLEQEDNVQRFRREILEGDMLSLIERDHT
ncbi:hypothetical protein A2U01_0116073, partial [Trifolium medium]|nr:hypothetical protein [Trifolium medium]